MKTDPDDPNGPDIEAKIDETRENIRRAQTDKYRAEACIEALREGGIDVDEFMKEIDDYTVTSMEPPKPGGSPNVRIPEPPQVRIENLVICRQLTLPVALNSMTFLCRLSSNSNSSKRCRKSKKKIHSTTAILKTRAHRKRCELLSLENWTRLSRMRTRLMVRKNSAFQSQ